MSEKNNFYFIRVEKFHGKKVYIYLRMRLMILINCICSCILFWVVCAPCQQMYPDEILCIC